MKNIIFACALTLGSFANAASNYVLVSTWTGNNSSSSAPLPSCECNVNYDLADCPVEFQANTHDDDICFDEYIPSDSDGWVHAGVFQRTLK